MVFCSAVAPTEALFLNLGTVSALAIAWFFADCLVLGLAVLIPWLWSSRDLDHDFPILWSL